MELSTKFNGNWKKIIIKNWKFGSEREIYISKALKRLKANDNIWILGNTSAKRQAILSFLVYSTTNFSSSEQGNITCRERKQEDDDLYMWAETESKRDKPLYGAFVAALLNDLFGIQSRGGCACAGPYGHVLLNIDENASLAIRSAILKVKIIYKIIKP